MAVVRNRNLLLLEEDVVFVSGFEYHVKLWDETTFSTVTREKVCSCGEPKCAHLAAVVRYLRAGGRRPPDPVFLCPVCGGKTVVDGRWLDRDENGRRRAGWRCENGGLRHFLEAKAERIKKRLAANPWLFPPVYDEAGECVYEGVLRADVLTWDECQEISLKVYLETGYDPRAA